MIDTVIRAEKNKAQDKIDILFVLLILLLCGIGLTTLFSGSVSSGARFFGDPLYFIKRQLFNFFIGFIALLFFASIRLEVIRKYLPKIVIFTLIISILTFIPGIGIKKNGAARWIGIGSSTFQPSELIKMVLVLFLANIFAKKYDRFDEPSVSIYPATILSGLFIAIVYLQNDLSTSLFLIFIAFIMFFISGVPISFFIKIMILVIPLVSFMVLTKEYRVERVISFFHPERDPLGAGYQVNAALSALGEGGFWGRGLGNGIRKISSIPEVQSDFIFAVWSEEMGFLGVLLYYALLLFFTIRGVIVSINSTDRFRGLLGFGCTSVIFVQSIMNCGVIVRAFPATGVPLPFFSSGGSSLIITLCLCGLILNVSRHRSGEDE